MTEGPYRLYVWQNGVRILVEECSRLPAAKTAASKHNLALSDRNSVSYLICSSSDKEECSGHFQGHHIRWRPCWEMPAPRKR